MAGPCGSAVPTADGHSQARLLLHTAAYALLHALRQWLVAAGNARLTLETLPLWLLKIGGRVRGFATRVYLRLASSPPVSRAGACSRRTGAVHE